MPIAARGWRPAVMSESNCSAPALKPSQSVAGSNATCAVADEQRTGLQQVAVGLVRQLAAGRDPDRPVGRVDAPAGAPDARRR